jgi:hypothetical protein
VDRLFDEDLVRLTQDVGWHEVVPAELGDLIALVREARADGGMMSDTAAEQVADELLDGAGFSEAHGSLRV